MAVASYFDKNKVAIGQLIKNASQADDLRGILDQVTIGIHLGEDCFATSEGKACTDLIIRLVARLYPSLVLTTEGVRENETIELKELAKGINNWIEFSDHMPTHQLILGHTTQEFSATHTYFMGSKGWIAYLDRYSPQAFGKSNNPIGAGFAACWATARLFVDVFEDILEDYSSVKDEVSSFSVYDFTGKGELTNPELSHVEIKDTALVGLGAIGNGVIWTLNHLETISGELSLIDHEAIELSNLQRYVLIQESDTGKLKCEAIASSLIHSPIKTVIHTQSWEIFIAKANFKVSTIFCAVDSKEDRILIQGSLPKHLFNAATGIGFLQVSSHLDFIQDECLVCSRISLENHPSKADQIAKALNIEDQLHQVQNVLIDQSKLNEAGLRLIAERTGTEYSLLEPYLGQTLESLYHEGVCGGLIGDAHTKAPIDTPVAFQSALAGILLVAEYIKVEGYGGASTNMNSLDILKPLNLDIGNPQFITDGKNPSGNCICTDPVYRGVYDEKWNAGSGT